MEHVGVVLLGHSHDEQLEIADDAVVVPDQRQVDFNALPHARIVEPFGYTLPVGDKGTVKIGGQYLNELDYQNIENFKIENFPEGQPPNDYGEYKGSMSNHNMVYENVVEVLTNHGVIATNGFEGLKTVEIIDKIYKAIR